VPLDRIGTGEIANFRASLVEKGLSENVDGPQADRRDDALRARGQGPPARPAAGGHCCGCARGRSGSPNPVHSRRAWHKCTMAEGSRGESSCSSAYLDGGDKGDRTPDLVNAIIAALKDHACLRGDSFPTPWISVEELGERFVEFGPRLVRNGARR